MKRLGPVSLVVLASLPLLVSSCVVGPGYDGGLGPGYAPVPGAPGRDAAREANQRGYNLGIRDARRGLEPNFLRYHNLYDSATKSDFGRGYMTGYRSIRPR